MLNNLCRNKQKRIERTLISNNIHYNNKKIFIKRHLLTFLKNILSSNKFE